MLVLSIVDDVRGPLGEPGQRVPESYTTVECSCEVIIISKQKVEGSNQKVRAKEMALPVKVLALHL